MPTTTYLKALKLEGLVSKVSKYGGFPYVASKLGLETWDKTENPDIAAKLGIESVDVWPPGRFESELSEIVQQFGYIPTQAELLDAGKGDLLGRINLAGGAQAVAERFGYQTRSQSQNQTLDYGYGDWERFEAALRSIINEIGAFPSTKWLRDNNYNTLEKYIYKYGGIEKVATSLGHQSRSQELARWTNKADALAGLKGIADELGRAPKKKDLSDKGMGGLLGALQKHCGGLGNALGEIGLARTRPPPGHWKNFDNVAETLNQLMLKLGHFPTQGELKHEGFGGLNACIYKYHGGLAKVKAKL